MNFALYRIPYTIYRILQFPGGNGEGATPVPIPNTEVKPFSADGTARAAGWESRTPPGILLKPVFIFNENGLFIFCYGFPFMSYPFFGRSSSSLTR